MSLQELCSLHRSNSLFFFQITRGSEIATELAEFNIDSEQRHQELLELLSVRTVSSDTASSVNTFQPGYLGHH